MSQFKHTPGPWKSHGRIAQPGLPHHAVAAKTLIARVYSESFGDEESEAANARLIAAAPDLLEALGQCAESLEFARDKLGMCGEGDGKDRKADAPDDIGSLAALHAARIAIAKATGEA